MMPVGFETYTPDGALQASSSMYSYALRKTGTVTTVAPTSTMGNTQTSQFTIANPGSGLAFCAVQMPGYAAALRAAHGTSWDFISNAPVGTTVTYFIFDKLSNVAPSAHLAGIECYDSDGLVTFSTAYRPLSVIASLSISGATAYYTGDGTSFTSTGRSLAALQGGPAAHQYHPTDKNQMTCWIGGRPSVGTNCDYWTYDNDGKMYGALFSADKATVSTASVSWDDVTVTTSDGSSPPPWEIPLKLFVVDVTGVPIGVTYF